MQTNVNVAKTTQTAVPELDMAEKTLYYLVIGEGPVKVQINVGQKTYEAVAKLIGKESKSDELKNKIEEHKRNTK